MLAALQQHLLLVFAVAHGALNITTLPSTGTAGGAACIIPFAVNGTKYYSCVYLFRAVPWCLTSTGDDTLWGQCPVYAPGSLPHSLPALVVNNSDAALLPAYNRDDWFHWKTVCDAQPDTQTQPSDS